MTYDGHVTTDGPAQHRALAAVDVHKIALGPMNNNAYLLVDRATSEAVLIDAAAQWPRIAQLIADTGARVTSVVTTHRHADHTGALAEVLKHTHAVPFAGRDDAAELPVSAVEPLDDAAAISFGNQEIRILTVRGHTPGSIVIAYADPGGTTHLFSGDSLFPGGVGATNHYPYQSFSQLIDDVEHQIFANFSDSTWVYPGHGDDTTIGAERPHLGTWRERGW